ncbi:hypothetical protein GCM10022380_28950 [Amycolatopsis tucumanensis]|uniref:Uncharacterized protein n=1 Tax=Amycolatopsis tucumanensis TaxID=401106 RepID=A0ABP7I4N2_9PSEU
MTTHDRWFAPPRSATIVGRAVDTIVWSSAASSIPSMIAATMVFCALLLVTSRTLVLVRRACGAAHPMVWAPVVTRITRVVRRGPTNTPGAAITLVRTGQ